MGIAPGEPLREIPGTVPSLLERRNGCAFASRCAQVQPRCRDSCPPRRGSMVARAVCCAGCTPSKRSRFLRRR
ncbi:MAG: hypothetical protein U1F25_08825 [Rubrivivax sp.]